MLICWHAPGGALSGCGAPATSTRPSAGDNTWSSPAGGTRSGSRKKNVKNSASATNIEATRQPAKYPTTSATRSAPPMNGKPAGSMRNRRLRLRLRGAVPAQDVFHLVLELELPLLEGDLFDLFGFREVMLGG